MTMFASRWNLAAVLARGFACLVLAVMLAGLPMSAGAQNPPDPSLRDSPVGGAVPGGVLGLSSDSDMWRGIRHGITGTVSIPDKNAARLVQSEGDNWRALRNGPLLDYSAYALGGIFVLLGLFFLLRGRIKVDHGLAGTTIIRFNTLERTGHWLLAVSFIILALTGLNLLYGKYILLPLVGKSAFATVTEAGKYIHNYVAFAFMAGLALIFVLWVVHNLPSRTDIGWILKGGGLFVKGVHPPAKKFNAGQKLIFWLVILGGFSLSLSGWALMFPFTTTAFASTFEFINSIAGTTLPTDLTPIQEQQYNQLWHTAMAVFMICVILAHIYIGSVGMQGAFDAMGSGEVDLNWAKEHHSLWVEEVQSKERIADAKAASAQPAE